MQTITFYYRDILVALTQSGRVLIWTHRSGHFKQSFKVGDSSNGGGIMLDCYQNNDLLIAAFDQKIGFIDLDLKNKKKISIAQEMSIRESNFKIRFEFCKTSLSKINALGQRQ